MSYTPSLTSTHSDLNTSNSQSLNNVDDSSSPEENIEAWFRDSFRDHRADYSSQQYFPASHHDVHNDFIGLFDAFDDSSFALPGTTGCGTRIHGDQGFGPSAKGSGELNENDWQGQVNSALESDEGYSTQLSAQLAQSDASEYNAWEQSADTTTSKFNTADPLVSSPNEIIHENKSDKRAIERNPHPSSDSRAKLRSKSYTCNRCKIPCKRSADLERHMRDVHGEGPMFECGWCQRRRGREDKIKDHCRKKHKQERGFETCSKVH